MMRRAFLKALAGVPALLGLGAVHADKARPAPPPDGGPCPVNPWPVACGEYPIGTVVWVNEVPFRCVGSSCEGRTYEGEYTITR